MIQHDLEKAAYKNLLLERDSTTPNYKKLFNMDQVTEPKLLTHIDIDTDEWLDYLISNTDSAQIYENLMTNSCPEYQFIQYKMGRNEENTRKLKFDSDHGAEQKESLRNLIGDENFIKIGIEPETARVSVLVHRPGHGTCWHTETSGGQRFVEDIKENYGRVVSYDNIKRAWFSVLPWTWGQIFQIGETVLHHWNVGDVYDFDLEVPHATINFGLDLKCTVAVYGEKIY